jgi:cation diffusion facilitator family transporter
MPLFPEKLTPPVGVPRARTKRKYDLTRAILIGIFIRIAIVLFEMIGVLLYGSSSLLLVVLELMIDVFTSAVLLLSIRFASKPPDKNHPFGHGRFEPLAGFQLGLLMTFVGGGMLIQQALHIASTPTETNFSHFVWIIALVATVLLEGAYHIIRKVAQRNDSPALKVEAIHYRIDAANSLVATIALLLAVLVPSLAGYFDSAGAILISLYLIVMGLYTARENMDQLTDKIPDEKLFEQVREAATRVKGIKGTEKLKIQYYGPDAHVDIDVEVDPKMTVDDAHKLSQLVRLEIQKEWPAVRDVIVHIEPYYKSSK